MESLNNFSAWMHSDVVGICTIVAKNYLPHARNLMQSVKAFHPEFKRFVLLVDRVDGYFEPTAEDFQLDLSSELKIPQNNLFHYKYTILELATAVKPYYMSQLLTQNGLTKLLYLDPDIMLFDKLTPVLEALDTNSIVLTPHLTGPLDDKKPAEQDILRAGAYNLGFIGVRADFNTNLLLKWWQKKLYNDCVVDLAAGLFVDQRWMDLVPGMFEGVSVLRDPGLNVAYWNLYHRRVVKRREKFWVNNQPLRFFHFSGLTPENKENFSKHQNRYNSLNLGPVNKLVDLYTQKLLDNGYFNCKKWPYAYGFFSDGSRIHEFCQRIVRDDISFQEKITEVNNRELEEEIINFVIEPSPQVPAGAPLISRLLYKFYEQRADLQKAFPNLNNEPDRFGLAHWFIRNAYTSDYNLAPMLVEPILDSLHTFINPAYADKNRRVGDHTTDFLDRFLPRLLNHAVLEKKSNPFLTITALHIYNIDEETKILFSDPLGVERRQYIDWFLKVAVSRYELPQFLVAPLCQALLKQPVQILPISNVLEKLKSCKGGRLLLDWVNSFVQRPNPDYRGELTQLAYYLVELDETLAARFNLKTAAGWASYCSWFARSAAKEYGLPASFVEPVRFKLDILHFEERLNIFDRWLLKFLNSPIDSATPLVTLAAYHFYHLRSDLQQTFTDPLGVHRLNLVQWFIGIGALELTLHPALISPLRDSLNLTPASSSKGWPNQIVDYLAKSLSGELLINWLNRDYAPEAESAVRVTRLAYYIYNQDSSAQKIFKDPLGKHNLNFARWFVNEAARQYAIPELFVTPVRLSLANYVSQQVKPLGFDSGSLKLKTLVRQVNRKIKQFSPYRKANSSVYQNGPVKMSQLHYFKEWEIQRKPVSPGEVNSPHYFNPDRTDLPGMNIIGYLTAPTGVGEAARRMLVSTEIVGIPTTTYNLLLHSAVDSGEELPANNQNLLHPVNLIQVNADQVVQVVRNLGRQLVQGRYNIGYWYWELSEFYDDYTSSFNVLNEIWVASSFVQNAIASKALLPVIKMPPCIQPIVAKGVERSHFDLPSDHFLFLTMFDMASVYERKNPQAVVEAFRKAFRDTNYKNVGLVIKVSNAKNNQPKYTQLQESTNDLPVWFVEERLSQETVNSLTNCCDCTISLHRSEGLGLTLAEAMYLGKPVIATAYSGNMDFTHPDNSLLVNYELIQLDRNEGPYRKGMWWADPDTEHAAHQMRKVIYEPNLTSHLARRGQSYIQQYYAPEVVGDAIIARLNTIYNQ